MIQNDNANKNYLMYYLISNELYPQIQFTWKIGFLYLFERLDCHFHMPLAGWLYWKKPIFQDDLTRMFQLGNSASFWKLWDQHIPKGKQEENDTQRLVFSLHLYFAVFPLLEDEVSFYSPLSISRATKLHGNISCFHFYSYLQVLWHISGQASIPTRC